MFSIYASSLRQFVKILYVLAIGYKGIDPDGVKHQLDNIPLFNWTSELPNFDLYEDDIRNNTEEHRSDLGETLKELGKKFQHVQEYATDELAIIKEFQKFFDSDSVKAWNKIVNSANKWSDYATLVFNSSEVPVSLVSEIRQVLIDNGYKQRSFYITKMERASFENSNPEDFAKYKALISEFNVKAKRIWVNYVAGKGGICDYQDLYNYLESKDIECFLPQGFEGQIDTAGNWWFNGEKLGAVLSASTYPMVIMNSNISNSNQWICKAVANTGTNNTVYIYPQRIEQENARHKFSVVTQLFDDMPKIRKKWCSMIKNWNPTSRDCISALVLEILFETAARIGSPKNSTFGINTLQLKHYSENNGVVTLDYLGKDSIKTHYVIKPNSPITKLVISRLQELVSDLENPNDPIFNVNGSLVRPANTNALFKRLANTSEVNVHKIRTYNGSILFKKLLEKAEKPKTQKEANQLWKDLGAEVGKKLNHIRTAKDGSIKVTPLTALQNYIDPSIQVTIFTENGFRLPKMLEKSMGIE